MNTGGEPVKSQNGLVTTLGVGKDGKPCYVLEGSVFVGGAAVQWLRDGLQLIKSAEESEEAALKVENSGGVYIVPAFTGLGAPYWEADARGLVCGVTRGTNKNHIIRACLEGIAYQVYDVVKAMECDSGVKISRLSVDGGASANKFLMQFQADILHAEVVRSGFGESTVLGAAFLAGVGAGVWKIEDIEKLLKGGKCTRYSPEMSEEVRFGLLSGWRQAVDRATLK